MRKRLIGMGSLDLGRISQALHDKLFVANNLALLLSCNEKAI